MGEGDGHRPNRAEELFSLKKLRAHRHGCFEGIPSLAFWPPRYGAAAIRSVIAQSRATSSPPIKVRDRSCATSKEWGYPPLLELSDARSVPGNSLLRSISPPQNKDELETALTYGVDGFVLEQPQLTSLIKAWS